MQAKPYKIRDLVLAGLFAGVVAVLRVVPPIPLPGSPVPITMQTLGVMLTGSLLGARTGALAMVAFLFLIVAGAPVLASGMTGPGVLIGPTGGYVLSWPLAAYTIGRIAGSGRRQVWRLFTANVIGGVVVVYSLGVPVMMLATGFSWQQALVSGALVFIPGDLVKALVATALSASIHRLLPATTTSDGKLP